MAGMTLAVEPMVNAGTWEVKVLKDGWTVDENGAGCTDAEHALNCIDRIGLGGILPVGGAEEASGSHKGYGFSMICELLCSIMSQGATSNHHVRKPGEGAGTCHAFIAIDPAVFGDAQALRENLSVFLQELRDAKRADENVPIYTHGEKEVLAYEKHMREGIEVDICTVSEMIDICSYLGMDSVGYLGEVDTSAAKASFYDGVEVVG